MCVGGGGGRGEEGRVVCDKGPAPDKRSVLWGQGRERSGDAGGPTRGPRPSSCPRCAVWERDYTAVAAPAQKA